jgi:hypothetical protein
MKWNDICIQSILYLFPITPTACKVILLFVGLVICIDSKFNVALFTFCLINIGKIAYNIININVVSIRIMEIMENNVHRFVHSHLYNMKKNKIKNIKKKLIYKFRSNIY